MSEDLHLIGHSIPLPSSVMVRQMASAVFSFIQSSASNFLFYLRQPNVRSCEHRGNSRTSTTPASTFLVFLHSLYDYAKLVPQIRRNPLLLHLLIISRRYYKFHSYFQLKTTPGVGHAEVRDIALVVVLTDPYFVSRFCRM